MTIVHPLLFKPVFKRRIWGGRKLETLFGKNLPEGEPIGESWELVDLEDEQSVVAVGPFNGKTLHQVVEDWGSDLLGSAQLVDGRFPLLIKFLDACETLSVQVHPDATMAALLGGRVRIKNEAWYVIESAPNSLIYRGARAGITLDSLRDALERGEIEKLLNRLPARKGHAFYLPSGTIHALGAGTVVAEIQTPSDITYRVFDWNRLDPATGQPRSLHIEEAMQCISLGTGPIREEEREHVASVWTAVTSLVRCESFLIERVRMIEGVDQELPYEEFMIWIVLEGHGTITYSGAREPFPFRAGDIVLIPAALRDGRVQTAVQCMWLEVSVPIASSLADLGRPERMSLKAESRAVGGYIPLNVPPKPGDQSRDRQGA